MSHLTSPPADRLVSLQASHLMLLGEGKLLQASDREMRTHSSTLDIFCFNKSNKRLENKAMNKLSDTSSIDFLGNSPSQTTARICLLWQECEIKSNPRSPKIKSKEREKSCLEGPPRELRISLSKSGFSHKKQIRQICTENLGASLLETESSSFELVLSSATRGCRGTSRNHFPLPKRWALRAQLCFFHTL